MRPFLDEAYLFQGQRPWTRKTETKLDLSPGLAPPAAPWDGAVFVGSELFYSNLWLAPLKFR